MTFALHPVHAQRLVLLVEAVRTCKHHGCPDVVQVDAWCIACGAARVGGQWLLPAWLSALERQMQHWQLVQVEGGN